MKRVLAKLLVAVVLLNLFPMAVSAAVTPRPTPPYAFSSGGHVLDGSKIEDFGNIILGKNSNILEIPIYWNAFHSTDGSNTPAGPQDIDADVLNDMMLVFSDSDTAALFPLIHKLGWKPDQDAKYVLSAQNIGRAQGTIKVVSYRYGWESDTVPINGEFIDPTINKAITALSGKNLAANGALVNGRSHDVNKLRELDGLYSGSQVAFLLDSDHFVWYPDIDEMVTAVRKSTLVNNQVRVLATVRKGKDLVKDVVIENIDGRAYAIVRFRDDFPYVDERDFDLDLFLTYKRKKSEDTMVSIAGSLVHDTIYLKGNNEKADLGIGGVMVEADGNCRNAELYLGGGVSVYQNLLAGKRYFGRATDSRNDGDLEIMNYFPDIKHVLTITSQKNISRTALVRLNHVEKDEYGKEIRQKFKTVFFVYDRDGQLLGTTNEMLPLRDKYFLAVEELDFGDKNFSDIEVEFYDFEEEPFTNSNANPSTGTSLSQEILRRNER